MKGRASFYTLGCRLNQTESAIMAKGLESIGFEITEDRQGADLCVVNTCTVTGQTDQKCRQAIRSIQRQNPQALIAVVGCFSQVASEQIQEIGGIHLILGNGEKLNLYQYIPRISWDHCLIETAPLSKESFVIETLGQHRGSTRANLKIQDGCDFVCSFCIIPTARGRSRSRRVEDIKKEALHLAQAGVKELILTGVNLGCFQEGETSFFQLLDLFQGVEGIERVRISSIEPTTIGAEVFALMKDPQHKLVPYLHLPLQSGHDRILAAMRRRYSLEEYAGFVQEAVAQVPGLCVGSDVIVGFPSETEEEFEQTYQALSGLPVHYFHVFPYAAREGTSALRIPQKVPSQEAAQRAARLRELSDQKRQAFYQSQQGQELEVLFEANGGGEIWQGYSPNYVRVEVRSSQPLQNQIRPVTIVSASPTLALGQLQGES